MNTIEYAEIVINKFKM